MIALQTLILQLYKTLHGGGVENTYNNPLNKELCENIIKNIT